MNKKFFAKATGTSAAAFLIAGTTAFTAFAAMPEGTVVIGNKAFSLDYANLDANVKEIREAVVEGGEIYVKAPNGTWFQNSGEKLEDASVIPAVEYKAADGTVTNYDAEDGEEATEASDLKVDSVSAINNLKTFSIKFNKPVDATTITTSTLKIYKNASATLETYTQALSADKMTLTVSLNSTLAQNDNVKVTIDGIKTVDASESITGFSEEKTATDVIIPTVTDVKATTSTTIDITFSEPMNIAGASKVWDEIYIDGVKTYATVSTGSLDLTNKITLTLATKLSVGSHTYKITSFRDWAGFPVTTREGSITVVSDTDAPSVASATVTNNNQVTVVFDEPVNSSTIALSSANFQFTEAGGTVYQVTGVANPAGDNKTYVLTLNAPLTPAAIVNIDLSYKLIADLEGNTVTTAKTYSFKANDDLVKPTVSGTVNAVNNSVNLTFSEKVNNTTATNSANYELYKDGKRVASTITVTQAIGDTTGTKYVASFSNAADLSGAYLLRINNVTDASIRANTIVANTDVAITLVDVNSPTLSDAACTKQFKDTDSPADALVDQLKIVVSYSENMDSTTALNLSNYVFNFGGADVIGSTITNATITFGADNKTVVITLPGTEVNATQVSIAGNIITTASTPITVKVLAVKDAAGNVLKATDINRSVTLTPYNTSGATLTSVKAIATNKVEIKSNVPFLSIDPNGIKFTGASTTTDIAQPVLVAGVSFSEDRKTATLTLGASLSADAKYDIDETGTTTLEGLKLVTVSDTAIVNNLGQNVAKGTYVASSPNAITPNAPTSYAVVDAIAPALAATNPVIVSALNADTVVLTFNENLGTLSASQLLGIANDVTVTISGVVLDPSLGDYVVNDATPNDDKIEIQILKDGITATDDVSVKLNNGRYIVDAIGNTATVFDAKDIKTGDLVNELVAPTATFVSATATTVVLQFSEVVDKISAEDIANYTFNDNAASGTAPAIASASLAADGKTVTLTFTITDDTIDTANDTIDTVVEDLAGNASTTTTLALN